MKSVVLALLLGASAQARTEAQDNYAQMVDQDMEWRRPLGSRNQAPLALLFIYMTPDRAKALERGVLDLDIVLDYSNIIQEDRTGDEFVRFDLEYLRTLISLRRGFGHGVEVGIEVPFFFYYGGFLDPFVSRFHEAFGFPNALRGETPYGLVDYQFQRGERSILAGVNSFGSVGEPTLHMKKTLFDRAPYALSARGAVKFGTGTPTNLNGSGATDAGVGIAFDRIGETYGIYLNANYHFLGAPEGFEVRDFYSFMVGADWRLQPNVAALIQLDYLSPPIPAQVPRLNEPGFQLGLGLRYRHSDGFTYEWRLTEDLSGFSPDFTFAFQIEVRSAGGRR